MNKEKVQQTTNELLDLLKDKELTYSDAATVLSLARVRILKKREAVVIDMIYTGE